MNDTIVLLDRSDMMRVCLKCVTMVQLFEAAFDEFGMNWEGPQTTTSVSSYFQSGHIDY